MRKPPFDPSDLSRVLSAHSATFNEENRGAVLDHVARLVMHHRKSRALLPAVVNDLRAVIAAVAAIGEVRE